MEDARYAFEVGFKGKIKAVDNYGKCKHLMPLCSIILCYALQGAVPELSFLAKPHQPNRHDFQRDLGDSSFGCESDNTHRHSWHEPNYGPAHDTC